MSESDYVNTLTKMISLDQAGVLKYSAFLEMGRVSTLRDCITNQIKMIKTRILAQTYIRDCLMGTKEYDSDVLDMFHSATKICLYQITKKLDELVGDGSINEEEYNKRMNSNKILYDNNERRFLVIDAFTIGDIDDAFGKLIQHLTNN